MTDRSESAASPASGAGAQLRRFARSLLTALITLWLLLVLIPPIIECGLRALEDVDDSLVKSGVFD